MAAMRVVLAPDKFKGSLTATEAAAAMARGVRAAMATATIDVCPIADGGEGFADAIINATGARRVNRRVTGPLADMKVDATFGILPDQTTAVIEMASAAGLELLRPTDRNPLNTTTFGVGELIRHAIELGCNHILLGIGGSATVDGGIGCCQATGHTIILNDGESVSMNEPLVGRDLERVVMVKRHRGEISDRVKMTVACDVTNPLCGPTGASRVFGPQKGASPADVERFDHWLHGLAARSGKMEEANCPGAGAAGGLGFGLLAFYGATLVSGVQLVLQTVKLADRLASADLCLTGEGSFDEQSLHGKATAGVAAICKQLGVPCVVLAGRCAVPISQATAVGVTASFSITTGPMDLNAARRDAKSLLAIAAENVTRLFVR